MNSQYGVKDFDGLKREFFECADIAYRDIRSFKPAGHGVAKGDGTPVTELDLKISRSFKNLTVRHGLGFFDEESDRDSFEKGLTLVADPLDGTRDTLAGLESVGISVAVLRDGLPILSYSAMPLLQEVITFDGEVTEHIVNAYTDNEAKFEIFERTKPLSQKGGAYLYVDPPLSGISGQHKNKVDRPEVNVRCEWSSVASCIRLATRQAGGRLTVNEGVAGYLFKSMPHDIASTFPAIWAAGLKIYDLCDGSEVTALKDNMFDIEEGHRLKGVWLICHPEDREWLSDFSVNDVIPHQFEGFQRERFIEMGIGGMLVGKDIPGMKKRNNTNNIGNCIV